MHRNIIPIVKPTRCTSVSNLFILEWHCTCFGRSFRPSSGVQDCTYSNMRMSNRYCCLLVSRYPLASRQQYMFDICMLLYVQSCTPNDGRKDRPKHVQCHSKINKFDTLVHLVGLPIGINWLDYFLKNLLTHGSVVSQEWIGWRTHCADHGRRCGLAVANLFFPPRTGQLEIFKANLLNLTLH